MSGSMGLSHVCWAQALGMWTRTCSKFVLRSGPATPQSPWIPRECDLDAPHLGPPGQAGRQEGARCLLGLGVWDPHPDSYTRSQLGHAARSSLQHFLSAYTRHPLTGPCRHTSPQLRSHLHTLTHHLAHSRMLRPREQPAAAHSWLSLPPWPGWAQAEGFGA